MPKPPDTGKPKVLIVVNVFKPDQLGGAVIFTDLAQGLSQRGFEVRVRCSYPYYPEWKDKSGLNGWTITEEKFDEVRVSRHGLYIPNNPNSLAQRLLYEFSFFLSLSRRWKELRQTDMIMVFCPLMGAVAFGRLAKFLAKKPLWLNIQDLPAQAAAAGNISGGSSTRIFRWIQNKLFNGYDMWSSISPAMIDQLQKDNLKNVAIDYVPNFLNSSLESLCKGLPVKADRDSRPTKLFYSGNIGSKQDLLKFCKILSTSRSSFDFRIHGGGSNSEEVKMWIENSNDERFSFGGLLEEESFIQTLHESDFCVITEKTGSGGSFIPSKIIPAISSQCPIFAISDPESPLGQEMRKHNIGFHLEWENLESKLDAAFSSLADNDNYSDWLTHSRKRALYYSRERVLKLYQNSILKLLHQNL